MNKPSGLDYALGNSIHAYEDHLIVPEGETRWRIASPVANEGWWVIGSAIFDDFNAALRCINEEIEGQIEEHRQERTNDEIEREWQKRQSPE